MQRKSKAPRYGRRKSTKEIFDVDSFRDGSSWWDEGALPYYDHVQSYGIDGNLAMREMLSCAKYSGCSGLSDGEFDSYFTAIDTYLGQYPEFISAKTDHRIHRETKPKPQVHEVKRYPSKKQRQERINRTLRDIYKDMASQIIVAVDTAPSVYAMHKDFETIWQSAESEFGKPITELSFQSVGTAYHFVKDSDGQIIGWWEKVA